MAVLLTLIGLLGGFVLSALFWWILSHRIVPHVEFSSAISRQPDRVPGRAVYRLKIRNASPRRAIIDIQFRARVVLPGHSLLHRRSPGATAIVDVPLDVEHLFRLGPGRERILWLDFGPAFAAEWTGYLPEALCNELAELRPGSLERLLSLRGDPTLRLQVLAFDEFSGARKFYESKRYRAADVIHGRFRGLDVRPTRVDDAFDADDTDDGHPPGA